MSKFKIIPHEHSCQVPRYGVPKIANWSSYFKGLYDQKKIPLGVIKMADNHLQLVFNHHQQKHDGRILPYFNYEKKTSHLTSSRKMPR